MTTPSIRSHGLRPRLPARVLRPFALAAFAGSAADIAGAQTTTIESRAPDGSPGNSNSFGPSLSAEGRWIAFTSLASNLVAGDSNGAPDVFLGDRIAGTRRRVSVGPGGVEGDQGSSETGISADGRSVVFTSFATNLVAGDDNNYADIFLHDTASGTTTLVSVNQQGQAGNGESWLPSISSDGRFVAFTSTSRDLASGNDSVIEDVFLRDVVLGATELVSPGYDEGPPDGPSDHSSVSGDGRFVVFESQAHNLVAGDSSPFVNVYLRDRLESVTLRIGNGLDGFNPFGECRMPKISADGRFVLFASSADNLVRHDNNGNWDVFLYEIATGATTLISADAAGNEHWGASYASSISADGRFLGFTSDATGLVPDDENGQHDVFVFDRIAGVLGRVSLAADGGELALGADEGGTVTPDGRYVAFSSDSNDVVPGDPTGYDVFVRERLRTTAATVNYGSGLPGALGVPALTASAPPLLNSSLLLGIGNSSGRFSYGLLVLGFTPAAIPAWQGTLLATPDLLVPLGLYPEGSTFPITVPAVDRLDGVHVYVQVLEADSSAAGGVAMTAGLDLTLGY